MVKLQFSKHYEAVRSRLRRLPTLVNDAMDSKVKKDVVSVIREFQNGIKRNNFGLEPLQATTIRQKALSGAKSPRTPLYEAGDEKKNSLYNALSYRKIKNGYRLFRRRAKHHKADLPLNALLAIHENGAIINVTDKMRSFLHFIDIHLRADTLMIRIPPRPVVDKAINRSLKKRQKDEPVLKIRKAIEELINKGNTNLFNKLTKSEGIGSET